MTELVSHTKIEIAETNGRKLVFALFPTGRKLELEIVPVRIKQRRS